MLDAHLTDNSGMADNAEAPGNGTLRNATTFLFRQLTAPENRARAVVGGAGVSRSCMFVSFSAIALSFNSLFQTALSFVHHVAVILLQHCSDEGQLAEETEKRIGSANVPIVGHRCSIISWF